MASKHRLESRTLRCQRMVAAACKFQMRAREVSFTDFGRGRVACTLASTRRGLHQETSLNGALTPPDARQQPLAVATEGIDFATSISRPGLEAVPTSPASTIRAALARRLHRRPDRQRIARLFRQTPRRRARGDAFLGKADPPRAGRPRHARLASPHARGAKSRGPPTSTNSTKTAST